MIFHLDTNDYENINITFTDDDYKQEVSSLIEEFCFAMSSFFVDFSMKLNCTSEEADTLKDVILDCTKRNMELLLSEGLLDTSDNETFEDGINELRIRMNDAGFSEPVIEKVIQTVIDTGSIESAIEQFKETASKVGYDAVFADLE